MLSGIIQELLKEDGTVALLHGNADPDALGSAYALQLCFPRVTIWAPGGLDRLSKLLAVKLKIEVHEDRPAGQNAKLVVLDTSGPDQIPVDVDLSRAIIIDHHTRNPRWESAGMYFCDDSKSSCSEIVHELIKLAGMKLPREGALALMYGILTDTGNFKFAKPAALKEFSEMMVEYDIQMDEAMELVVTEQEVSEKVSQLRGAQRLKYWKVGKHIVAISMGSAYEASVCKALMQIGADIVFVGSQRGETFRISARATPSMVRMGVHLGKLLGGVGSETSNGGGGHPGAAGISGVGDVEAMLNICAENAMRLLKDLDSSGDA